MGQSDCHHPPGLGKALGTVSTISGALSWRDRGIDFWDTAGQERFQSMHASYYHQAHACIMVFDVQRKVTYKNLNSWYRELREFRPEIPCIVVANKIDADMKVTQKSFNFARKFSLPFYFVSAADGTNVVKLFNDAIRLAVAYKQHSGDFMDQVLQELESFDLQKMNEDSSDKEKSCPEEETPSA
ncbi:rab-like protein 2A isoform X2 [Manacus candei]|uniref:rab-like protein 2A isoform X2 n=1 Tax=Manacus candei TaxID=415023 RepID=UPI002225C8C6|nr:rab-like protein 2A isoform X2 [Manacus candei]